MEIKTPAKYDRQNQSVNAADGRVMCIVGWPGLRTSVEIIDRRGREITEALNNYFSYEQLVSGGQEESSQRYKEEKPMRLTGGRQR